MRVKYNARWPDDNDDLAIELGCIRYGGRWKSPTGEECGAGLLDHYMNARKLLWPERYRHRWTDLLYQTFIDNDITILMGCASCVSGDTRLLNPQTGEQMPIEALCRKEIRPLVMTLDGPELADVPFLKGYAELFEITLSDGRKFKATSEHRVLTELGFQKVSALSCGQPILAYGESRQSSNLDNARLAPISSAARWWKTTEDSQSGYQTDCRCDGEPPHPLPDSGQAISPLPAGVHKHSQCALHGLGDPTPEYGHTLAGQQFVPLSSCNGPSRHGSKEKQSANPAVLDIAQPGSRWCLPGEQSPFEIRPARQASKPKHDVSRTEKVLALMPYEPAWVKREHISSIVSVGYDFYYDLEVPRAHHYFAEGAIHHNSQKTSHASEFVLMNYWARPEKTLVIESTITMEKLDTGVFGETKMLWELGKQRYRWLAGHLLENRRTITTKAAAGKKSKDDDTVSARNHREGIVGKPCYVVGKFVGNGILAGIKQEWVYFLADELQFMAESFLACWPNLFSNPNVKIIGSGNPKHDPDDQLGIAAEPKDGWQSQGAIDKTAVWKTNFSGGVCVNLVGTDSPNFDVPEDQPEPYPRLIGRKYIRRLIEDYGENSPEFFSQAKGVMRIDMADARVITRLLCRQHFALLPARWSGSERTRVYGLDPSYGGGDLCIAVVLEFGMGEDGIELLSVVEVINIIIDMSLDISAEDQVADHVSKDIKRLNIPVENVFYDPYGKGTMGFAFARKFGSNSPIPVDSGGRPTDRPARFDLFVDEPDGKRRLKTCREHYSKFITEEWFSVRYAIEADQFRGLPNDVMLEGCSRKYQMVAGNKIEVESKDDLKMRLGHSPNKFDALAIGTEGARQRGFGIERLGKAEDKKRGNVEWFEKEAEEWQEAIQAGLLNHTGRKTELSLNL